MLRSQVETTRIETGWGETSASTVPAVSVVSVESRLECYLDALTAAEPDAEARQEWREEARLHLLASIAAREELGTPPEQAVTEAIQAFGDPAVIERGLKREAARREAPQRAARCAARCLTGLCVTALLAPAVFAGFLQLLVLLLTLVVMPFSGKVSVGDSFQDNLFCVVFHATLLGAIVWAKRMRPAHATLLGGGIHLFIQVAIRLFPLWGTAKHGEEAEPFTNGVFEFTAHGMVLGLLSSCAYLLAARATARVRHAVRARRGAPRPQPGAVR